MKKKFKLLKPWNGKKAGDVVEMDAAQGEGLVTTGFAEEVKGAAATLPPPEDGKKWYTLKKQWGTHPAGETLQLAETDAKGLVDNGYAELARNDDAPGEDVMAEFLANFEKGINAIVQRATDQVQAAAKRAKGKGGKSAVITGGNARNDRFTEEDGGFESFGDFARDVHDGSGKGPKMPERLVVWVEKGVVKSPSGMNETIGEEGGFLIPPRISTTVWERAYAENDLLVRCDQMPMQSNILEIPGLIDDNRATGLRWGGVQGYWLDEGQQKPNSKPKFFKINLRLHKIAVLIYTTDELLQDSPISLETFLTNRAGSEIRFLSSDAIINGDNIGKPLGILNAPSLITVAAEDAQPAATINFANINKMWARLWAPSRANAVWLVNQEVEPQLDSLFFPVLNGSGDIVNGFPVYQPQGGISGQPYSTIKGRPVIPTEWNPALGSKGDIILADLSQYMVGTKGGVQSAMSIHLRFDYDETAFRFVLRMAGQPAWNKAVTPYRGTSGVTYSPYVTLAARP